MQFRRTLLQLNLATRDHRVAANTQWLKLLVPTVTRQQYIEELITVYGFDAPLESALRYTPGLSALVDLRARARSGLIVEDLMRLGLRPRRIAALSQRFMMFSSTTEALGWMYASQCTTLPHGAVRRHLRSHLPELDGAVRYLSAYGVAADGWRDLDGALQTVAHTPQAKEQLIGAAIRGFTTFCAWFNEPPDGAWADDAPYRTAPSLFLPHSCATPVSP